MNSSSPYTVFLTLWQGIRSGMAHLYQPPLRLGSALCSSDSHGGIELHSDSLLIDHAGVLQQLGANLQLGEVVHILSPNLLVFNIHVVNCIGLKQTPGGRM